MLPSPVSRCRLLTGIRFRSFETRDSEQTIPGFPSYFWFPETDSIHNHTTRSVHILDFAIFCTLAHRWCRIWFAYAMCAVPFYGFLQTPKRPCHSNCLPCERGGVHFFQPGATWMVSGPGRPDTLGKQKKPLRQGRGASFTDKVWLRNFHRSSRAYGTTVRIGISSG